MPTTWASKRKAAYVEYAQAVPLKYAIDGDRVHFLEEGQGRRLYEICPTGAVDFDQKETTHRIQVGDCPFSRIHPLTHPSSHDYQYAKLPNVITSMEFERMLSASGPTAGHSSGCPRTGGSPRRSPGSSASARAT